MKHFKGHKLAILPLLTVLSMSPATLKTVHHGRSIASVQEEVKPGMRPGARPEIKQEVTPEVKPEAKPEVTKDEVKSSHPKYDLLVSKTSTQPSSQPDLTIEKFKAKREELAAKLKKDREEFKKDQSDKKIVEDQRKLIEQDAAQILLVESALADLQCKKDGIDQQEEETSLKLLEDSKIVVEGLIADLESNEVLVAKATVEPKKEDKPVVVADSKPTVKPEVKPDVKPEVKPEEPKKEEPKKEVACEAEKQNKVLTAQVEDLMKQNQQILQAMLGMTNMMVSMFQQQHQQQQQPNPFYSNGPGYQVSPYQYQQPQSAGNWVYYPSGFQPQQQNIFSQQQPMMVQQAQPMGSIYPNQMNQQMPMAMPQQSWNMQPQNYFGVGTFGQQPMQTQPQYQPQQMNLGMAGTGFNMSNNVPTLSQR